MIPKTSLFVADLLEHIYVSLVCVFSLINFFIFLGLDHHLYLVIAFAYEIYL